MIKFQKREIFETLANKGTNKGQQHNAHMCTSRFQGHLYDAISRFEVLNKPFHKCNERI